MEIKKGKTDPKSTGRPVKYDFDNLSKDEYFQFERKEKKSIEKMRNNINACAYERGFKIITRVSINEENGWFKLKVWKQEPVKIKRAISLKKKAKKAKIIKKKS